MRSRRAIARGSTMVGVLLVHKTVHIITQSAAEDGDGRDESRQH